MTKRPEALLLGVGAIALAIAGVLACTHQPVPSWDVTVIIATLVGGGVATPAGPVNAVLPKLEAALEPIIAAHRSTLDAILREVAAVTTHGHTGDNQPPPSAADPVTSVTTPPPATQTPADPTGS